ncbi:MAG: hypothetical protein JW922_04875, partial [Paludibacteraceae bacterium]|nr:hypothetical protein [Paludibacteraceae bacterium]
MKALTLIIFLFTFQLISAQVDLTEESNCNHNDIKILNNGGFECKLIFKQKENESPFTINFIKLKKTDYSIMLSDHSFKPKTFLKINYD